MNLAQRCQGKKIHSRNIEISTYKYDDKNIVVEGVLKDDVLIPIYVSGKERQPHTPHNMIIQILIECSTMTIKETNVEMPCTPYKWCKETSDSLNAIKGLKIESGFTSKVKKMLQNSKKCLHLTTLLFAIIPTIMQGYWIFNARRPGESSVPSGMIENYLVDTCWVWRNDGPLVKMLIEKQNNFKN